MDEIWSSRNQIPLRSVNYPYVCQNSFLCTKAYCEPFTTPITSGSPSTGRPLIFPNTCTTLQPTLSDLYCYILEPSSDSRELRKMDFDFFFFFFIPSNLSSLQKVMCYGIKVSMLRLSGKYPFARFSKIDKMFFVESNFVIFYQMWFFRHFNSSLNII